MTEIFKGREVHVLEEGRYITVIVDRRKVNIKVSNIRYILMKRKFAEIHLANGQIYNTRTTYAVLEKQLGEDFLEVRRGCTVYVMAIKDITDKVNLWNDEKLKYTARKKNEVIEKYREKCQRINGKYGDVEQPETVEEYHRYYKSFDNMPFAFADIEMVFDEEVQAVDWIFRYGNAALAQLEKMPLEELIDHSFGSLFANMDAKWLRSYERTALYGETLEVIDYSPEIDTYLKVICFPTFKKHCGCILFNLSEIEFSKNGTDTERALMHYLGIRPFL